MTMISRKKDDDRRYWDLILDQDVVMPRGANGGDQDRCCCLGFGFDCEFGADRWLGRADSENDDVQNLHGPPCLLNQQS